MASIDDLFKKPTLPSKRKLEAPDRLDPTQAYKSAKLTANGDTKGKRHATIEDEDGDDTEAGPSLPPEDGEEYGADDDEDGRFFGGGVDQGTADALDYLDTRDTEQPYVAEKIDSAWLRKLALNFEKRISKNAELRAKYEDDPQKFMGSEADLDADVKALSILSEHPELYEEFARLGSVDSLVSLLSHENTDIAIDVIEIISELTDEDVNAEQAQWDGLVDALLKADLLSLLLSNLSRFDESNDADRSGVYHSLAVLENLASQSTTSTKVGQEPKLLEWLLGRAKAKEQPVSQNKQYAAEILAILLQSSPANRTRLTSAELNGVDTLLQLLAPYRKRDPPKDSDEEEFVENIFDALTCLVDEDTGAGKAAFVEAEGVELALIMLREGKMSKTRALRLLDHAYSGRFGAAVCEKLVEAAGLKTVFGMFMKKQDAAATEHLLGIFASLLRSLPGGSPARIRTLAKFVEKDYEKLAKAVQLRRDYSTKVRAVDQQTKEERVSLSQEEQEDRADEWFSRRLDAGLFCLQTIDVILAWLVAEDDGAKKKIMDMLAERDEGLADLRSTLQEQLDGIEEPKENERGDTEEGMLKDMLGTLIGFLVP
ncbi:hypothetical protein W97_06470 [Coniosporium apollinis CBS 100218]|uniref:Beta-catenin-like protein 1 N-terminal domain-containing protein n=1 Tax=Coniosporium apollinis (strain CBS 100218) TaxID=1168221 RepID=R7YZ85_CONA1|nr:uncharacterized protein W97_06470 [Coniosporium apollinis CBS 100218]EON67217.1 hypothetical protein W97_06470 [Coniosporium apollinis CBS 100218]